ncbi:O-antigen ligase family protein [Flavobacteriaceae bacterium M23B6Z8]
MPRLKFKPNSAIHAHQWFLLIVAITTLMPMSINNLAIMFLLVYSFFKLNKEQLSWSTPQILFLFLFLSAVVTLIYAQDLMKGVKSLEKILNFLLFPLIFATVKITKKDIKKILLSFALVTFLGLMIAYIISLKNTLQNGSIYIFNPKNLVIENVFKYHRLSSNIGLHPTYLSSYTLFSLVIIAHYYLKEEFLNTKKRFYCFILILYFGVSLYLLNSFAVLVSAILLVPVYFLFHQKIKKVYLILIAIPLLILASKVLFSKTRNFTNKISYEYTDTPRSSNWNSINSRLAKWSCTLEVIEDYFPFGIGKGNGREALIEKYEEKGFELGYINKYTAHNMYLTFMMETGILGLLLFIILIGYLIILSIRKKSFLLISIAILLAITSITEDVLERNKGIVFYSFFILLITANLKYLQNHDSKA